MERDRGRLPSGCRLFLGRRKGDEDFVEDSRKKGLEALVQVIL
jgi:hypothetical protein